MADMNARANRPVSPHLSIYRPMLTMMMSIVHRITGVALYFGMVLVAWWLIAVATGPEVYADFTWFMGSIFGQAILFGFTWALIHHSLGGMRHLVWDLGHGLDHPMREYLAQGTIIGSIVLTILLWVVGYIVW